MVLTSLITAPAPVRELGGNEPALDPPLHGARRAPHVRFVRPAGVVLAVAAAVLDLTSSDTRTVRPGRPGAFKWPQRRDRIIPTSTANAANDADLRETPQTGRFGT